MYNKYEWLMVFVQWKHQLNDLVRIEYKIEME